MWDNLSGKVVTDDDKKNGTAYEKINKVGKGLPDTLVDIGKRVANNLGYQGKKIAEIATDPLSLIPSGAYDAVTRAFEDPNFQIPLYSKAVAGVVRPLAERYGGIQERRAEEDVLANKALTGEITQEEQTRQKELSGIGDTERTAFAASELNSMLFDAPEKIYKALPKSVRDNLDKSDAIKYIQASVEDNPNSVKSGKIAGDVANMFLMDGALKVGGKLALKGLSKIPKISKVVPSLEKLGKWAYSPAATVSKTGMKSVVSGAMKGAAKAVPQAALYNIFDTDERSAGDRWATFGSQVALGGLLGGTGTFAGNVASRAKEKANALVTNLRKSATKSSLESMGVTNRVVKSQNKYMGKDVPEYLKEAEKFGRKNGLFGVEQDANLDKWEEEVRAMYRDINDKLAKEDVSTLFKDALNDAYSNTKNLEEGLYPFIHSLTPEERKAYGAALTEYITDTASPQFSGLRKNLWRKVEIGARATDKETKTIGDLARYTLDAIDDKVESVVDKTGLSTKWADAKKNYKYLKLFQRADFLDEMKTSGEGVFSGGDIVTKMITAGVAGDENKIAKIAQAQGGKWIQKAIKKLNGPIARTMLDVYDSPVMVSVLKKIDINPKLAIGLYSLAEKAPQSVPAVANLIKDSGNEIKSTEKAVEELTATEAKTDNATIQEAKDQVNADFMDKINSSINDYYIELGLPAAGITIEEWSNAIKIASNNYDPKICAGLLFKGDKEGKKKYLESYDYYLAYKGINMEEALNLKNPTDLFTVLAGIQKKQTGVSAITARNESDRLKDIVIASTSELSRTELDKLIKQISQNKKLNLQQKTAELETALKLYGFDPDIYRKVGV